MKKKIFMLLTTFALLGATLCPTSALAASKKQAKSTTTTEAKTKEKEPVNLYIFHSLACGYCELLLDYLNTDLLNDAEYSKLFNVVYITVSDEDWTPNETNTDMFRTITNHYEVAKPGLPFYVVGDEYSEGFAESSTPTKLKTMIKKAYENKKYKDVVGSLIDVSKIEKVVPKTEQKSNRDNNMVGYIVLGITAIAIVAIIFGRSKTATYYEE